MRIKLVVLALSATAIGLVAAAADYSDLFGPHDSGAFNRVRVGMTVVEVQAILGAGTEIAQSNVPSVRVAVNTEDEDAARESANNSGGSPPTARNYPTRSRPVVEGDFILEWVNGKTGERILVAFLKGVVCEKHYRGPDSF